MHLTCPPCFLVVVAGAELIDPDLDTECLPRSIAHADDQRSHVGEGGIAEDSEGMRGVRGVGTGERTVERCAPCACAEGGITAVAGVEATVPPCWGERER